MTQVASSLKEYYAEKFVCKKQQLCVGVELEFPIITNSSAPLSLKKTTSDLFLFLISEQGFFLDQVDNDGIVISVFNSKKRINISLEYCHAVLEFSVGPFEDLNQASDIVLNYIKIIRDFLRARDSDILDAGFNFQQHLASPLYLNTPYHNIIRAEIEKSPNFFTGLLDVVGKFASVQTHLDVSFESLVETINLFSSLSWVNALLFSNSYSKKNATIKEDYFCVRDFIWWSMGLNRKPGHLVKTFNSDTDYFRYLSQKKVFFVKRNADYIYFNALPYYKYIQKKTIDGKKYCAVSKTPVDVTFIPQTEDAEYLKILDYVRPSRFGTLELRGDCQQPFQDMLSPVAFNFGALICRKELENLMVDFKKDAVRLRALAVKRGFDGRFPVESLQGFLLNIIAIIKKGLHKRKLGEEQFINCLQERVKNKVNPAILTRGKDNLSW